MSHISFVGKEQVDAFRLIVISHAMRLYLRTGMKANRAYTPANMLAYASTITGKTYKRSGLKDAYADLREMYPDHVKEL